MNGIVNKHLALDVSPLFLPLLSCFDGDKLYIVARVATACLPTLVLQILIYFQVNGVVQQGHSFLL